MDLNPFTKFMGCPFFGKQEKKKKEKTENRIVLRKHKFLVCMCKF